MPTASRLLLALALSGAAVAAVPTTPPLLRDGLPHPDPQITSELPRFLAARTAHFLDWFGDGSMLIRSERADATQIERLRPSLAAAEAVGSVPAAVMSAIVARPYTSDAFIYAAPGSATTDAHPNAARRGAAAVAAADRRRHKRAR